MRNSLCGSTRQINTERCLRTEKLRSCRRRSELLMIIFIQRYALPAEAGINIF